MVTENSAAIAALHSLNQNYRLRLKYSGPIVYNWEDRVNSKAKTATTSTSSSWQGSPS